MFSISRLFGLAIIMMLASCAVVNQQGEKPFDGPLIWPQPPDQPRFAYEVTLRSAADILAESEEDHTRRQLTGETVSTKPEFNKPAAIVAQNGRIYVADIGSSTILVFDVPRRKLFRFGTRQPGTLQKPSGLALDAQMNVYVSDTKQRTVFVYDSLGLFQRKVGGPQDLERPSGVAVSRDGERIYVIDRSNNETINHRVVVYDKGGKKLQVIGTRGAGDGEFNVPLQGVTGADGKLYVLDSGNFRVQVFDRDGKFLRAFGKIGIEPGTLARPRGIAVDKEGNIYVSDSEFNNIQIFNSEGQLLLTIGEPSKESNPGRYGLLSGLAVDETGRLYVVDQLFNKVEVIRRLSDSEGRRMLPESNQSLEPGLAPAPGQAPASEIEPDIKIFKPF